jgi:tRNA (cmo5U34)-methyltransferase
MRHSDDESRASFARRSELFRRNQTASTWHFLRSWGRHWGGAGRTTRAFCPRDAGTLRAVSQFHFDPDTYMELMREEVPAYERLQEVVADTCAGLAVDTLLDLGTGTGETLLRVLVRYPGAAAVGIDESEGMLGVAATRLEGLGVDLRVADLADPLPDGPFDLVVSALAVHHLDGPAKAALFARVAAVLRPGGRFVLGDVVVPVDPADAVTPLSEDFDRPSTVAEQLGWLEAAGLDATAVWFERDLAVVQADRI